MTGMGNRKVVQRLSPLWLGIGIGGFLLVLLLVTETLLGRWHVLDLSALAPFARQGLTNAVLSWSLGILAEEIVSRALF